MWRLASSSPSLPQVSPPLLEPLGWPWLFRENSGVGSTRTRPAGSDWSIILEQGAWAGIEGITLANAISGPCTRRSRSGLVGSCSHTWRGNQLCKARSCKGYCCVGVHEARQLVTYPPGQGLRLRTRMGGECVAAALPCPALPRHPRCSWTCMARGGESLPYRDCNCPPVVEIKALEGRLRAEGVLGTMLHKQQLLDPARLAGKWK